MELKQNSNKDVYVLGELIHNAHVINELTKMGIKTVPTLPQNGCGYCVIRSHGVAPEIIEDIENKGYEILDMTCPDVKKVQQKAVELVQNDYLLLILGKESHPEVEAIKANALQFSDKVFVINNEEDLKLVEDKKVVLKSKKNNNEEKQEKEKEIKSEEEKVKEDKNKEEKKTRRRKG